MKIIPTNVHGIFDYLFGLLLICAPLYIDLNDSGAAKAVLIFSGFVTILYSILTSYELGLMPFISMHLHIVLDFCSALFLLISPWICGFYNEVWWPHVLFASVEFFVISLSQTVTRSAHHID
jgi:hypothetical protein